MPPTTTNETTITFNWNPDNETVKRIIYTLVILGGALLVRILLELALKTAVAKAKGRIHEKESVLEKRLDTVVGIATNVINVSILSIATLMILETWGINITPIIASAGIVGLAISFGSQALVHDVVTGFFILLEGTFNVGDKITVAGKTGTVTQMNIRSTILTGDNGVIYTIPNSQISTIENFRNAKIPVDDKAKETDKT